MKIAIVGATGNVGQRLTAEALSRGHEVTALARKTDGLPEQDNLHVAAADILSDEAASILNGHDAVIYSLRFKDFDYGKAIETFRKSDAPRLLIVGGAASLLSGPGGTALIDTPGFPEEVKIEAEPARQVKNKLVESGTDDWTYLSPSIMIGPGERTGKFRLGDDVVLKDAEGNSHISYEDYAVAMIDEAETPKHQGKRFTVGY
ncbi:NAD(P)-dependent oxidoreductase [Hyphococcus luteus]|uniref:3-beta hydroxysteroid dehydrogenase n=1 Tax=Hyphococcus luteus TaxID=2058213 RepID=A0A2S7K346_9PROT|nr:NAD(P)H-binding protein [Marinicaulis flavus]PQA86934.1 3-beta hydroxysteroid dehydrogenase [Marinicaulis flavus]